MDEKNLIEGTVEETVEEVSDDELIGAIDAELEEEPVEPEETEETEETEELDAEEAEEVEEPEPAVEAKSEEPEKEEKPSDEFGTLDKDTPEKTRERFETLKTRYDEIVKERDEVVADAQQWKDAILGTGTNAEQFGETLRYLKKVNSNKPEDLEEAYEIMKVGFENLSKMLGKPMPGVYSPLDEYPDLKQRVDEGMLDEQDALEIAQARASKSLGQVTRQQEDQQVAQQNAMQQAMNDIRQLGDALKKSDPMFNQKLPMLEPIIQAVVNSAPNNPGSWVKSIKDAYSRIPVAAQPKPQPAPAPNSIRPGSTSPASSNMAKEPGSELEAIDLALQRGY